MSGHTKEPVLLTEAEWKRLLAPYGAEEAVQYLGERGLIAPEPVDAMLLEAREIAARVCEGWALRPTKDDAENYRQGDHDDEPEIAFIIERIAALRLAERPKLTRERVREAYNKATEAWTTFDTPERFMDLLHAALTAGEVGNG